jgi:PTH1 family peptidyl-tRNA hydrolase
MQDNQTKFRARVDTLSIETVRVLGLKPLIFMNRSGQSVAEARNFYKYTPEELLVIHDDLELEFGTIGLKKGGGLGGHNGLRSLVKSLGTREFYRLRIGISRPRHGRVDKYVLGSFTNKERMDLQPILQKAADIVRVCLKEGMEKAVMQNAKVRVL